MPRQRWTPRAVWRYAAFQIPETALFVLALIVVRRWLDIPAWAFWSLIAAWVAKDLVLFPFVWRSFEPAQVPNPMIGGSGVAEGRLAPSGWVRIGGERWKATVAEGCRAIEPQEPVRVRAIEGLTLIVEPDDAASAVRGKG